MDIFDVDDFYDLGVIVYFDCSQMTMHYYRKTFLVYKGEKKVEMNLSLLKIDVYVKLPSRMNFISTFCTEVFKDTKKIL